MKRSIFSKVMFCLIVAVGLFSLGTVSAECVTSYSPPDVSKMIQAASPILAMAAVAIPVYDLEKLKCVSQGVFKDLQAKYGKLYVIDVVIDESESYQFLVRRPQREHLEIINSHKNDVTKSNDFIVKNLVVAGNESKVLDDGVVFAGFDAQIAKIIRQAQAFLSKA